MSELGRDLIVILSTYIVSDVESIAKEIIMIKDKKVLCQQPIEDIYFNGYTLSVITTKLT